METKHLLNKHGARITAIHAVAHDTYMGVADWFYICDLEWEDGGTTLGREVPPWAVCFDHDKPEAHAEYSAASEKLNAYLLEQGNWHDPIHKKDGRIVNWTPKLKKFSVAM